ncbi:hypothetical protein ACWD5Q_06625 [Streptomyces sp. NPDC002513]
MIVHDAAEAFTDLIAAAVAWVQILAGLAAIVLCALPLCVAPAVRAARRAVARPSWARGRILARIIARRTRTTPWAHTQPLDRDYEEAA